MEVDVGCGHGDFLVARAQQRVDRNVVGLEIRVPMTERVQRKIERAGLKNAAAVTCNANLSFRDLFETGSLQTIYVHFPDPWFKKRHHKRRVMTPQFLTDAAACLRVGGELRFMTDFGEYADEVVVALAERPEFEPAPWDAEPERPLTHREEWHQSLDHPIQRHCWKRRA